jgi:hypothetical protein
MIVDWSWSLKMLDLCHYFVKMRHANSNVVREAACQAIAKLAVAVKFSQQHPEQLQLYVPSLLQALLICVHDDPGLSAMNPDLAVFGRL